MTAPSERPVPGWAERPYDIALFGATGFVGTLIARHLAAYAPSGVRIALAGRTELKLAAMRRDLGPRAAGWALVVADVDDPVAMARMAASTRVLATTVGPYQRYGAAAVAASARAGTDYLDLTGEVLFVRDAIDTADAIARESGARLINSCGFDSIPSDLGVFLLAERAEADGAGSLTDTTLVVRTLRGGVSGGTIDSMRAQFESVGTDPRLRATVGDPYALSPDRSADPDGRDERDGFGLHHDPDWGWTGPFVMAGYNTRIVRRSNALLGYRYGHRFRYRELTGFGRGWLAAIRAAATTVALGGFAAAMAAGPTRRLLDRVLPAPGAGPSPKAQRTGRFQLEITTTTTSGGRYRATVAAAGDPGYAATAVMFGQSALTLLLDRDRLPPGAGVLTPAAGLGRPLVERLRTAGMTFSVDRLA